MGRIAGQMVARPALRKPQVLPGRVFQPARRREALFFQLQGVHQRRQQRQREALCSGRLDKREVNRGAVQYQHPPAERLYKVLQDAAQGQGVLQFMVVDAVNGGALADPEAARDQPVTRVLEPDPAPDDGHKADAQDMVAGGIEAGHFQIGRQIFGLGKIAARRGRPGGQIAAHGLMPAAFQELPATLVVEPALQHLQNPYNKPPVNRLRRLAWASMITAKASRSWWRTRRERARGSM